MNHDLVPLVRSWRNRIFIGAPPSESDTSNAIKLAGMLDRALCQFDDRFFAELTRAVRKLGKGNPHDALLWAFRWAYSTLTQNGQKPTWAQVTALAVREFGFSLPSKSTLKRIRRKIGFPLPDPPRGKAKKRGQKK